MLHTALQVCLSTDLSETIPLSPPKNKIRISPKEQQMPGDTLAPTTSV